MISDYDTELASGSLRITGILAEKVDDTAYALAMLGYTSIDTSKTGPYGSKIVTFSNPESPVKIKEIVNIVAPAEITISSKPAYPVIYVDHDSPREGEIQLSMTVEI